MWPVTSITSNYFNDIETADLLADGLVVFLFVHAGQTGAKVPCSAFNNFLVSVGLKGIVQLAELACWLLSPSNQLGLATGSSEHETTFTTTGPPPLTSLSLRAKKPSLCVLTDTLARSGRGTLAFTWPVFESARTTFFLVSRKIRAVPFGKREQRPFRPAVNMTILCQNGECGDRDVFLSASSFSVIFKTWTELGVKTQYTCPDMSAVCWNKNNANC